MAPIVYATPAPSIKYNPIGSIASIILLKLKIIIHPIIKYRIIPNFLNLFKSTAVSEIPTAAQAHITPNNSHPITGLYSLRVTSAYGVYVPAIRKKMVQ